MLLGTFLGGMFSALLANRMKLQVERGRATSARRRLFYALLGGVIAGFASRLAQGCTLERAGFSSSRRLAGVFYFTDMAVVKVMFTALITALLGLSYLSEIGWIQFDQIFLMPTIYGAQIIGGLLFGVGFVMGAWCPGTAAAGAASGKIDAIVFLLGAAGGSIVFNEIFPILKPLYTLGDRGTQLIYENLGISRTLFVFLFTLVAIAAFWLCEWAEKKRNGQSRYWGSSFLKSFCFALVVIAGGLFLLAPTSTRSMAEPVSTTTMKSESALIESVDRALDHMEPEELADRLMAGESNLVVVDVRPAAEFDVFHIRGAINIPLAKLAEDLSSSKNQRLIVLYSNGMTHPAQARDSLQRLGFNNVYLLTDGITGFRDRCLKPVSLRSEPLTSEAAARVNQWRAFFTATAVAATAVTAVAVDLPTQTVSALSKVVETDWLAANLAAPYLKVIDLRPQPEYNTSHIPGSLSLNVESLRGNLGGVPSMLLPASMLAAHFSLLGLSPSDSVVIVAGDKFHDTTLASMAFHRLGHQNFAVLSGGYAKWAGEGRPSDAVLPTVIKSVYPVKEHADDFTVDYHDVAAAIGKPEIVIIDVRPADFYTGKKSDEARAGHISGALNRPFSEDVLTGVDKSVSFKLSEDLAVAYRAMIPSQDTEIIVHCRTGHQASQTFFVLKYLLGYTNVRWYDAGWTEWAARPELPIQKD